MSENGSVRQRASGSILFLPAILLTGCAAFVVGTSFLPWGFVKGPWGKEWSYNGLHEPLGVPNWQVSGGVLLAALLAWLRAGKIVKVPWALPLLLTGYSSGHVAWFCWFFSSGRGTKLSTPPGLSSWVGSGAYLAGLGCATAFVVCAVMLVVSQRFSTPDKSLWQTGQA